MKKNLLLSVVAFTSLLAEHAFSQCSYTTSTVADVTLQCNSNLGTSNRTGVAFNPTLNLYYSVNAGSGSYYIETFSVTGGNSLAANTQGSDYRGYWWNPVIGQPEGNTFGSGGVYTNSLNASGYAVTSTSLTGAATMPNSQSCGSADFANNRIFYYDAGTIYRYSKSTNTLISSSSISGLPASTGNLNSYGIIYVGIPGAEVGVYNYVNKVLYFINGNTGAYTASCSLPSSAPAASSFMMGYANGRLFLFDATAYKWYGYPILGPSIVPAASPFAVCSGGTATLTASNAVSYTWTGSSSGSITVSPTVTSVYTVQGVDNNNCMSTAQLTVIVNGSTPSLAVTSSTPQTCLGRTISLNATGALSYTWSNGAANGATFTPTTTATYTVTGLNGCGSTTAAVTVSVAPLAVSASSSSSLVCSGQPATLTASSTGTLFSWSSLPSTSSVAIASPTANTIYTVTASAGGCSGTTTLALATKPNPTLSIAASNTTICNGNSANLTVTGNAQTYTWTQLNQNGTSVSVNPTLTTLYTVVGTNSVNCTSSANQVIIVYANPILNVSVSNQVVCSGGSSTLTASGANTYQWSTSDNTAATVVNPTSSSTYSVTGTNTNNCSSTNTVAVTVFTPTMSVSGNTAICMGSNAVISANGADTYSWTNNGSTFQAITVTPTVSTTYSVTGSVTDPVSNISCPAFNVVVVTVNPSPTITATANHSFICIGNSAILTAGGAGATGSYTWTGGAGAVQSESMTVSPITNQTYSVAGIDANGCKGSASILLQVSACTGINSIAANASSLVIYPNPSNGEFTIEAPEAMELTIINSLGQEVKHLSLAGENNYKLNVSGLQAGVYFIAISGNNLSGSKKIVIQQ